MLNPRLLRQAGPASHDSDEFTTREPKRPDMSQRLSRNRYKLAGNSFRLCTPHNALRGRENVRSCHSAGHATKVLVRNLAPPVEE